MTCRNHRRVRKTGCCVRGSLKIDEETGVTRGPWDPGWVRQKVKEHKYKEREVGVPETYTTVGRDLKCTGPTEHSWEV